MTHRFSLSDSSRFIAQAALIDTYDSLPPENLKQLNRYTNRA